MSDFDIAVFHDVFHDKDIRVVVLPNGLHTLLTVIPTEWHFVRLEHVESHSFLTFS